MTTSKTGKHGHAKCHFTALDIFTNKKMEMLESSSHNVEVRRAPRRAAPRPAAPRAAGGPRVGPSPRGADA